MKAWATLVVIGSSSWLAFWFTPDQQGQRLMDRQQYEEAASTFRDPMRQGVAWFRAGEFKKAEPSFARNSSAEGEFNRGNCLIMQGKYEKAVERFDRALELRPNWEAAETNRSIALARGKAVKREGGDTGDQQLGADEITFDKKENTGGQETQMQGDQALSDSAMQAMWLRRVQTKPAEFLKAKFAYQLAMEGEAKEKE
jgi:Ca-activated chloride channel family protein